MGSTLEAVYNGVPLLLIPKTVFCDEVAYRAEELGLGWRISNDELSVANIRSAIGRILGEGSFLCRAESMRDRLRSSKDAKFLADKVEESFLK